ESGETPVIAEIQLLQRLAISRCDSDQEIVIVLSGRIFGRYGHRQQALLFYDEPFPVSTVSDAKSCGPPDETLEAPNDRADPAAVRRTIIEQCLSSRRGVYIGHHQRHRRKGVGHADA